MDVNTRDLEEEKGFASLSAVVARSVSMASDMRQSEQAPSIKEQGPSADAYVQVPTKEAVSTSGLNIEIRLSGGQVASFYIPDKLTTKDVQKLKGALEGFGSMIDSLISEEP
jgi:hypothetical protein